MNDNAHKWVEALRSGEFEQAQGRLRRDDGYCCLGVACEVYHRETNSGIWENSRVFIAGERGQDYSASGLTLPDPVREWLGLNRCRGEYTGDSLTNRNDDGATLAEIADLIQSEPDGLFA